LLTGQQRRVAEREAKTTESYDPHAMTRGFVRILADDTAAPSLSTPPTGVQ
jgi:hypothetical protein